MRTSLRRANTEEMAGKEVFAIQPIILGGSPTDPANKAVFTRGQHIKAVTYWNRVIKHLRHQRSDARPRG